MKGPAVPLRRTGPACTVVRHLLDDPDADFYGYQLMKATGYDSGTLYDVLKRLVDVGWLTADERPQTTERRQRRHYRWTPGAPAAAADWLTRAPVRSKAARDVLRAAPLDTPISG